MTGWPITKCKTFVFNIDARGRHSVYTSGHPACRNRCHADQCQPTQNDRMHGISWHFSAWFSLLNAVLIGLVQELIRKQHRAGANEGNCLKRPSNLLSIVKHSGACSIGRGIHVLALHSGSGWQLDRGVFGPRSSNKTDQTANCSVALQVYLL